MDQIDEIMSGKFSFNKGNCLFGMVSSYMIIIWNMNTLFPDLIWVDVSPADKYIQFNLYALCIYVFEFGKTGSYPCENTYFVVLFEI